MARREVIPFRLERGASVLEGGGVRFAVWAPSAERVGVRLGTGHRTVEIALEPAGDGLHEGVAVHADPGVDYVYRIGEALRADPVSRHQPFGVGGPSRVVDPRAYPWSDSDWGGVARADLVIYELHVGTFSGAGTFDGVSEAFAALRDLGVTAVELMPVAEFPGGRNWGYDGVFPYAPQSTYGGPEGLKRLVDAAHGAGLAVILDVVYNHLGPEGNLLADFGPYFTDRYRTPWGSAINLDGPESDEVRRFFRDNALYWLDEYHLDGLRLDAVHEIHDRSASHFLLEIAEAVHELEEDLGRLVHVIAESDLNDPRLVRDPEHGGYSLDAVWSDDFHHAVHAVLTGEKTGYYADFGGPERVAKALRDRFVYDGQHSRYRRRRHGAPAGDVPADRFVVCVQNHDQIGNRAFGERLSALVPPARLRLAAALLLLSPYIPLLFMGEEYGEPNPFLYFVSHADPALLDTVRRGRSREFAAFDWRGETPDPASEETFRRSCLQRDLSGKPGHAELRDLYAGLLRVRREEPALRPGESEVHVECGGPEGWVTVRHAPPEGRAALAIFNLGAAPVEVPIREPGGDWRLRLTTGDTAFGGPGCDAPARVAVSQAGSPGVRVGAETALLYVKEVG